MHKCTHCVTSFIFNHRTLLDVLCDRRKAGKMVGECVINGRLPQHLQADETAYVKEDDVHIASLTVRETISFAVQLRCGLQKGTLDEVYYVSLSIQLIALHIRIYIHN